MTPGRLCGLEDGSSIAQRRQNDQEVDPMSATETATERAAIEQVVQLYIDGVSKGDGEKLRHAFHESAWMYGSLAGTRYDEPISELIALVTGQPLDSDGSYDARIASVVQVEDAATAVVEEDGCWGGISFTSFFALAKIDGRWQIVNKTFAHTAGELPTA
jgi:hypothetical protein